jgi:hypothetical protein
VTTYPEWTAGDLITAAGLNAGQMHSVIKSTTETVTSSTALQDDNELIVPLEADATYYCVFLLALGGVSAADVNTEYSFPSGATGFKFCQGPQIGSADRANTAMVSATHNLDTDRNYGATSTTSVPAMIEHVVVTNGSTAGNLTFRWAQNASSATGSVNLAGSAVMYVRVA